MSRNWDYYNEEISACLTFSNVYNISYGEIASSYATGKVSGNEDTGGLAGVNAAMINSSYWNLETTGQSEGVGKGNSNGVKGLTTDQMIGQSAYIHMYRFDFDQTWQLTENYPLPATKSFWYRHICVKIIRNLLTGGPASTIRLTFHYPVMKFMFS